MLHQTLDVKLPHTNYPIYIGVNLLALREPLLKHIASKQVVIVTSPTIPKRYLNSIQTHLSQHSTDIMYLPDGEANKTLANWQSLITQLAEKKIYRDATLITLGGGMIGDVGGFAAACYQRGISWLQIPTTLLAQVDASIGGKVGVNLPAGKNLVGSFYQPNAVIIDIHTLNTLGEREFHAGLAEVVKAALINDTVFFEWLEAEADALLAREETALITMIGKACSIKRDIVIADERENGCRALLNLGHTFAHALEHALGYGELLHGEAVAIGLVLAARLSHQLDFLPLSAVRRIESLLTRMKLPITLPSTLDTSHVIAAMHRDKKVRAQGLRLILLRGLGEAFIYEQASWQAVQHCLSPSVD